MTRINKRIVASVPAARRAAANSALEALGYGPDTFSVALWNLAGTQILRYACDWQAIDSEIVDIDAALVGGGNRTQDLDIPGHASGHGLKRRTQEHDI